MIALLDKRDCCGCSACVQVCPRQCINMVEDEEGFLYPKLSKTECVDCHLCEKVCPSLNTAVSIIPKVCYAVKNSDEDVRKESSSGGFFSLIAEFIIDLGGVVFGPLWNKDLELVHSFIDKKEDISKLRGSKYVQSNIDHSYRKVEAFLNEGRYVLFSGTPCQVSGLKRYLRKDFNNLVTVDFICHGVPSPGVFRWYFQEMMSCIGESKLSQENGVQCQNRILSIPKSKILLKEGIEVKKISFRDKTKGWRNYSLLIKMCHRANGNNKDVDYISDLRHDPYLQGFISDYYLRPSCYSCPIKPMKNVSDITMADFWGIWNYGDNEDKGVSAVMFHNDRLAITDFKDKCTYKEYSFDQMVKYNRAAVTNPIYTKARLDFWKEQNLGFSQRIEKLRAINNPNIFFRIIRKIKRLIS